MLFVSAWFGFIIDEVMGLWTGHIHGSFDFFYMVVHYVYGHGLYWLAKSIH